MTTQTVTLTDGISLQANLRIAPDMIRLSDGVSLADALPLTFDNIAQWDIRVDWNNDGEWEDKEIITDDVLSIHIRRGRNAELASTAPGECEIVVRNDLGNYSPDRTGGVYYGNLVPGRFLQLRSIEPLTKTHFVGFLEDIIPDPDPDQRTCYLRFIDKSAQVLAVKQIRTPLRQNYVAGDAVADILDQAGWAAGNRELDPGQTTFSYFWIHDKTGLDAIRQVEEAEYGLFYVRGDGKAIYEDRHHRLKGYHLSARATFNATMIGMDYQSRLREIKNEASIKVYPRVAGTVASELWRLRQTPEIVNATKSFTIVGLGAAVTASIVYYAEYDDPASSIIDPVATTDYTFNSQADGLGTDLTDQLSVVLHTSYAQGAVITVTNTGPQNGFLTLLKIRGTPQQKPDPVVVSQGDVTSQNTYGRRTWGLDNELVQNPLIAQDYADYIAGLLKDPKAYLKVKLANVSQAMTEQILQRDISDRVHITEPNTGADADYFIEQIEWKVEGNIIEATWLLSQASALNYWLLGEVGFSELGDTTRLGY